MKGILLTFLTFVFLALPSLVGAQVVIPTDCSAPELPVCEVVVFAGQPIDTTSDFVLLSVQSFEVSDPSFMLTDLGLTAFVDGLNSEEEIFTFETDLTDHAPDEAFSFLNPVQGDGFRLLYGSSNLIQTDQEAVLLVVVADGQVYNFLSLGAFKGFMQHVEDVVTNGDITIVPEGFEFLDTTQSAAIISNVR